MKDVFLRWVLEREWVMVIVVVFDITWLMGSDWRKTTSDGRWRNMIMIMIN